MKILVTATMLLAMTTSSHAVLDGCVKVKPTPDGFLALRAKPTARSTLIGTLTKGVVLDMDTRGMYDTPEWTHVFIGAGRSDAWVATKYIEGVECPQ